MELFKVFGTLALRGEREASEALGRVNNQARSVGDRVAAAGRKMTSVGKSLSLGLTAPLGLAGGAAVSLAVDAEETANKFDVVFRGSVEAAEERIAQLRDTIPMTTTEMKGMAAGIQDLLVPMGVTRDEASGMSLDMLKLAGDLGSFNNVPTAQVLEAMKSALAGSSEPMRRFGVDTRKTRLETIALEEGLIRQGEELDQAAMGQAVLAAITRDSSDAVGDAARTVNSTANQMKFFTADIRELGEEIGRDLIPVFREVLTVVRSVTQGLREMSPFWRRVLVVGAGLAAVLGPLLVIFGTMATGIVRLVTLFARFAPLLGRVVAVGSRFIPVVGQIIGLISAIVLAWRNWDSIVAGFSATWDWLIDKVADGIEWLVNLNSQVRDFLVEGFRAARDGVMEVISNLFSGIRDVFSSISQWLSDAVNSMARGVIGVFTGLRDGVVGIWTNIRDAAVGLVRGMVDRIRGLINSLYDATVGRLRDLWNTLVGNSIIVDLADDVVHEMTRMADGSISESDRMAQGVESASSSMGAPGMAGQLASAAQAVTVDMRHSIFRDDRDMEERLRRSGVSMAGAF